MDFLPFPPEVNNRIIIPYYGRLCYNKSIDTFALTGNILAVRPLLEGEVLEDVP
jgi:hypothetical protein